MLFCTQRKKWLDFLTALTDIDYKDCSSTHFLSKIMIPSWHFSFTAICKFTVSCVEDVLFIASIGNINKYLLSGGKVHILSNSLLSTSKLDIEKWKALKKRWGLFMLFVQYRCTFIFSVCFCAVIYVQRNSCFWIHYEFKVLCMCPSSSSYWSEVINDGECVFLKTGDPAGQSSDHCCLQVATVSFDFKVHSGAEW